MDNQIKLLLDNDLCPSSEDLNAIHREINKLTTLLHEKSPQGDFVSIPNFIDILKKASILLSELVDNHDIVIAQYHFKEDCFYPIGEASLLFFLGVPGPYTMARLRKSKRIGPESTDTYNHFLDQMCRGIPADEVIVKIKDPNHRWQWFHCSYSLVPQDPQAPKDALILCKKITEKREHYLSALRFHDFMQVGKRKISLETRAVVLNVSYNLSEDTLEFLEGDLPEAYQVAFSTSYTKAVERIGQDISSSQREVFFQQLSRESLLERFALGKSYDIQEFLMYFRGKPLWIRIFYQLLRDPYTSFVNLWLACRNITPEKTSALHLLQQAQFDHVTGIYNRAAFIDGLQEKFTSPIKGLNHAFVLIDIDGFGRVNDVLGHAYGDCVLKDIAQTLQLLAEPEDLVARVGGDEFAFFMHHYTDLSAAKDRLRMILAALYRELKAGLKLSVSAGMALFPQHGDAFQTLYENADLALYNAKKNGKNQFSVYLPEMDATTVHSMISPIMDPSPSHSNIYIRTFGYFDLFLNGEAVLIPNAKAKELLALLVDRRGGFISSREIISYLWEGEPANERTLARCRKAFMQLKNTLKAYHLENLITSKNGNRKLNTEYVDCDLFHYMSGKEEFSHLFKGVYMMNYSWGEYTLPELEEFQDRSMAASKSSL